MSLILFCWILDSHDRSPEDDKKVFVLSLLLSSYFLYNTKNVIDRDAIKKLAIITDSSNLISNSIKNIQEKNFLSNSPNFVWCLETFS